MNALQSFRLLIFLVTLFSMASYADSFRQSPIPSIPGVRATLQRADEPWYLAGPAINTLFDNIYTDQTAEFSSLQQGTIDFADTPVPADFRTQFTQSSFYNITRPQFLGVSEIQFNLANNFWGCNFNFGNYTCGIRIRQGIAHFIDKALFVSNEPHIQNNGVAIDNPPSSSSALFTPNSCAWDALFIETGSNCVVGKPGGNSFHLAPAAGVCVPSPLGGCSTASWMQKNPSPDFCAGAEDISAGLNMTISGYLPPGAAVLLANPPGGTFPNGSPSGWTFGSSTDCHLVLCCGPMPSQNVRTLSQQISNNPVIFYIRKDNPAIQRFGESLAEEICALWSGSFTIGCNSVPVPGWP